jgi:hypothetical protein
VTARGWFGVGVACCVVLSSFVTAAPATAVTAGAYANLKPAFAGTTAPSATSLNLLWVLGEAKRYRLYMNASRTPPGTPRQLPKRPALRTVTCPCRTDGYLTIHVSGLVTGHVYNFSLYGSDGHGHVRRGVSHPVLARRSGLRLFGAGVIDRRPCDGQGHVVRDQAGGYHAISGCVDAQIYDTRRAGATTWTRQQLPGADLIALTPDAATVVATVLPNPDSGPNRVSVTSAPASAAALPPPSEVTPDVPCTGEGYDECPTGLVTFPDGDMGLLLSESCAEVNDVVDRLVLAVGRPSQPFTETTVADYGYDGCSRQGPQIYFGFAQMTRDPTTGELIVVDWSNVEGPGYYAWTQHPGQAWVGPVKVAATAASMPRAEPLQLTSLDADHGEVWVGLDRDHKRAQEPTTPATADGAFLVHRSAAGVWDPMIAVPGSDRFARHPVLTTATDGAAAVLYTRVDQHDRVGGSGLRYVSRASDGTWSATRQLTRWWLDQPVAVWPDNPSPTYAYTRS